MEYCLRLGRLDSVTKKSHGQSSHDDTNNLAFEVIQIFDSDPLEELFFFLADEQLVNVDSRDVAECSNEVFSPIP